MNGTLSHLLLIVSLFLLPVDSYALENDSRASVDDSKQNGLWVMTQVEQRETGRSSSTTFDVTLTDKRDRTRRRVMTGLRMKSDEDTEKLLIRFLSPADIRGTSLLVLEVTSQDDERFLYLPALGRVRRISSREKHDTFAGTDLSYEDIGGWELGDYTYRRLEDETFAGRACYVIEASPLEEKPLFPRVVSWVDRETFLILGSDYFDRRDVLTKLFRVKKWKKIDDIWTVSSLEMENRKDSHRTKLELREVEYNMVLDESLFTKRALEQGGE